MKKADKLGKEYDSYSDQIGELTKLKGKVTNQIKSLAAKDGTVDGKQTTLIGDNYIVGFVTTDPSDELDHKKLKKAIGKKMWLMITSRVLNNAKLELAIKEGKVPRTVLSKCMTPSSRKPQQRVIVKALKNETNQTTSKKEKGKLGR
jgi:hypothetical protein